MNSKVVWGDIISTEPHYAAFISYAHSDEKIARRLHETLETYDIPDGIVANGRESISPIFRDVTELTAAHSLSEKIQDALRRSSHLIVLCSPESKASRWVNEEIRMFRDIHGDRKILCAIVGGVPSTSFPAALTEGGREPLAANLIQGREGFRFGVHQLAASLLGVGLDSLVQRAEKRRRFKARLMTAGSTAIAIVMGGLAFTAFDARDEAESSRDDAEALVEYMITDLKSELHALQRLDILDSLGDEIVNYYDGINPEKLTNEKLARLITAIQSLAEVAIDQEHYSKAETYLDDASELVDVMEARDPKSDDSIFYRAQNEYWVGLIYKRQDKFAQAKPYWLEYDRLSNLLYQSDPDNIQWMMEAGWGANNLSILDRFMKDYDSGRKSYERALVFFKNVYEQKPDDMFTAYEYANIIGSAASIEEETGNFEKAIKFRKKQIAVVEALPTNTETNYKAKYYHNQAKYDLLIDQEFSPCTDSQFDPIRQEAKELYLYEPENSLWRDEYITQQFHYIRSCIRNGVDEDIERKLSQFLKLVTEIKGPESAAKYSVRIKKLRAKSPEPLD